MTTGDYIVIDRENKKEYTVDFEKPLGAGATATVYAGVTHTGERAAVKIARRGTPQDQLLLFWQELDVVSKIRKTHNEHVPWAFAGLSTKDTDLAIILLEFVDNKYQLLNYAQADPQSAHTAVLPHDLAVETAIQYARLLADMHRNWITTRGDRKATDFRWLPQANRDSVTNGRLVVLDWNRAGDANENNTFSETYRRLKDSELQQLTKKQKELYQLHQDYIHQDIRILGDFWLTFLVGKTIDQAAEEEIQRLVPWGLRDILNSCRVSRPGRGYKSAEEVVSQLQIYQELLNSNLQNLAQTLQADIEKEIPSVLEKIQKAREALTIADLLQRRNEASTLSSTLRQWGEENLRDEANQISALAQRITNDLLFYPSQAAETAKSIMPSDFHEPAHRLIVRRWQLLAIANQQLHSGALHERYWEDFTSPLQKCLELLAAATTSGNEEQSIHQIEEAQDNLLQIPNEFLADETKNNISFELFKHEIDTRLNILKSKGSPNLRKAGLAAWDELNKRSGTYALDVRADLPLLDDYLSERTRGMVAERSAGELQPEWHQAYDALIENFVHSLSNSPGAAPPSQVEALAKSFQEAFVAYGSYRLAHDHDSAFPEEDQERYDNLIQMSVLNDRLALRQLPLTFMYDVLPKTIERQMVQYAIQYVEKELKEGWSESLDEAGRILKLLQENPTALPETGIVPRLRADRQTKSDTLLRIRKALSKEWGYTRVPSEDGESPPLEFRGEQLIELIGNERGLADKENLEQDLVYTLLNEAVAAGIEIADRDPTRLAESPKSLYGVHRLLALRTSTYYMARLNSFAEHIIDLSRKGDLRAKTDELEKLRRQHEDLRQAYGAEYIEQERNTLESIKGTLSQLNQQYASIQHGVNEIGKGRERIQSKIGQESSKIAEINETVSQLQGIQDVLEDSTTVLQQYDTIHADVHVICNALVVAGLQAVSRLELALGEDCLNRARSLKTNQEENANTDDPTINFLEETVKTLQRKDTMIAEFRQWADPVRTGEIAKMEERYSVLISHHPQTSDSLWGIWPITEIHQQHRFIKRGYIRELVEESELLEGRLATQDELIQLRDRLTSCLGGMPVNSELLRKAEQRVGQLLAYITIIGEWSSYANDTTASASPKQSVTPGGGTGARGTADVASSVLDPNQSEPSQERGTLRSRQRNKPAGGTQSHSDDGQAQPAQGTAATPTETKQEISQPDAIHALIDKTDNLLRDQGEDMPAPYQKALRQALDKYTQLKFTETAKNHRLAPHFRVNGQIDSVALQLCLNKNKEALKLYLRIKALNFLFHSEKLAEQQTDESRS